MSTNTKITISFSMGTKEAKEEYTRIAKDHGFKDAGAMCKVLVNEALRRKQWVSKDAGGAETH